MASAWYATLARNCNRRTDTSRRRSRVLLRTSSASGSFTAGKPVFCTILAVAFPCVSGASESPGCSRVYVLADNHGTIHDFLTRRKRMRMSSPDAKQSVAGSQSAGERQSLRRRLGMWLSLVVMVAVVAALVSVLLLRPGVTTTNSSAGGTTASSQWQTYHDPLGLFTLRLPPGWLRRSGAGRCWCR